MNIKRTKEQKPSLQLSMFDLVLPIFTHSLFSFRQILSFKIRIGVFLLSNLLHIISLQIFFSRGRARASSAMTSQVSSAWLPATAPSTFPSGSSQTSSKQVDAYHSSIFAKSMCFVNEQASQIFLVQNVIILLHKPITNPQPIVSRSNIT